MNLVLENPLVRLARSYGWAVLLIAVTLAMMFGGFHALTAVGATAGFLGGAAAGVAAAGALRVKRAREALEARRKAEGKLFICPNCLIADTPTRACPGCRRSLPLDQILTGGDLFRYCSECRKDLSTESLALARPSCAHCGQSGEGGAWSDQPARVTGVLSEADFETASALIGGPVRIDRGIRYVRADEANGTLLALCLADFANSRAELPARHAAEFLSSVWVDQVDALAGTEALDRLAQRSRLSPAALKEVRLCVAGTALDTAAERAFSVRLGPAQFQVAAPEFLGRPASQVGSQPAAETIPNDVEGRA